MGLIYAFDTNAVVHYLWGNKNVHINFNNAVLHAQEHRFVIPRVVDYELCRGFEIKPVPKKEAMYNLLTSVDGRCAVVDMGERFWREAKYIYAELYRKHFTVGELDILIAAFCMYHNCTLVTANTKDFVNMDGLRIVDWTQPLLEKPPP